MGFWPFGKTNTVESVSRIVSAKLEDGRQVRGKLAVHFVKPVKEAEADEAGEVVSIAAEKLLLEQRDHEKVIGAEGRLSSDLLSGYSKTLPPARGIELAALHVVGDVGLSDSLRRKTSDSGSMRAVKPEGLTPTPPPAHLSSSNPPGRRRSSSSSMRTINSLLLPPGSPPAAIAAFIAPLAIETSARLLIGTLRAHDLIVVRKVTVDAGSADMLASLVSASEAPPGVYDVTRAAEITRWTRTLGEESIEKLRLIANEVAAYLALASMKAAGIPDELAREIVQSLSATTFTEQPPSEAALDELLEVPIEEAASALTARASKVLEGHEDASPLAIALAPLFPPVVQDMKIAADIVRHAMPQPKGSSPSITSEAEPPRKRSSPSLKSEVETKKPSSTPPKPIVKAEPERVESATASAKESIGAVESADVGSVEDAAQDESSREPIPSPEKAE